jgi:hypothetical protein
MSDQDIIAFPKGGIQDASGVLNPAGHSMLARMVDRLARVAGTAEQFLVGGKSLIRAQAIFAATKAVPFSGGGEWAPDLSSRLNFKITINAPLTILYPANVPQGDSEPFFSVWVEQGSAGGWPVSYGPGFMGQAPVVLANPGDRTLLGFNVYSESEYTGWAVKGVPA